MHSHEWVELFEEQWFYKKWEAEFLSREQAMLEDEWFGIEDWIQSQWYKDFVSGSFWYGSEHEWNFIEEEWIKIYTEYEG